MDEPAVYKIGPLRIESLRTVVEWRTCRTCRYSRCNDETRTIYSELYRCTHPTPPEGLDSRRSVASEGYCSQWGEEI